MNPRVLFASIALVGVALLLPATALGQAPRTAWGDPDLQGTWTNTTTTPLERPADLEGKQVLTDEEWAARNSVSGISDDRPFDTVGFYNDYWLEQGQLSERTSLIVEPPNGKLPPYTQAAEERIAARRQYRSRQPSRISRRLDRPERLRPLPDTRHAGVDDARLLQPQPTTSCRRRTTWRFAWR